jgi:hypothetical protein
MSQVEKPDRRDRLALYSTKCKRCKHLDPAEKTAFKNCHFSTGNKYCPAKGVQMVVVGRAYRLAEQCKAARDRRDAVKEAQVMASVAKENEAFRERFYTALETPPEISK